MDSLNSPLFRAIQATIIDHYNLRHMTTPKTTITLSSGVELDPASLSPDEREELHEATRPTKHGEVTPVTLPPRKHHLGGIRISNTHSKDDAFILALDRATSDTGYVHSPRALGLTASDALVLARALVVAAAEKCGVANPQIARGFWKSNGPRSDTGWSLRHLDDLIKSVEAEA